MKLGFPYILPQLAVLAMCFWLSGTVESARAEDGAASETPSAAAPAAADSAPATSGAPASGQAKGAPPATRTSRGLSLVYDPGLKKYFVGGSAQFTLRQNEESPLVDRIEVSIDGGAWQQYVDAIQFREEGKHSVKFRAVNPVNSWSPVQFVDVFVDLEPPLSHIRFEEGLPFRPSGVVASLTPNGAPVAAAPAENFVRLKSQITFVGHDNLSGVQRIEYSWDSETAFQKYEKPLVIERLGKRTLYYRTIDRVGNTEATQQIEVFADGTAPVTELTIGGGNLAQANIHGTNYSAARDSMAVQLSAIDDGAGLKDIFVKIDGQPEKPYIKPIYFLKEGPHTLSYYAVDHVGNKEAPKTLTLYTVSDAPRTKATPMGTVVNTGGIYFARSDLRLKLEAAPSAVGLERIEYRLDEQKEFQTYTEPVRMERAGDYLVVFRSVDRVGNREPSQSFRVTVTQTPPKTKIETAQPLIQRDGVVYSPSPNVITMNAENQGVGVDQTLYSVNDGPFQRYTGPFTLTHEKKIYKIGFKSLDKLGNEEPVQTVTYHMIGTAPVVDLFVSDPGRQAEQVRTDYFENPTPQGKRSPASTPAPKPASKP